MVRTTTDDRRGRYSPQEIRSIRLQLGVTQAEFAQSLGVSEVAVIRWEQGDERPSRQARGGIERAEKALAGPSSDPTVSPATLRAFLQSSGLTPLQAARAAGVPVRSFKLWLAGKHEPRPGSALKLRTLMSEGSEDGDVAKRRVEDAWQRIQDAVDKLPDEALLDAAIMLERMVARY